jgi:flagellar protein FliS
MMTYSSQQGAQSAYRQNAVMAATPEQLVVMLYEQLIISLKKADRQIRAKDFAGKAESLVKANDIVLELLASLDFEKGGEIASRLASLYGFFTQEISTVGRTLDTARIAQLVEMAEELHDSWSQAARMVEGQRGGGTPSP